VHSLLVFSLTRRLTGGTTHANCIDPKLEHGRRALGYCLCSSSRGESIGSALQPTTRFTTLGFVDCYRLTTVAVRGRVLRFQRMHHF